MAKVQIKSEKLTPFGGIFWIMELFDALLAQDVIGTDTTSPYRVSSVCDIKKTPTNHTEAVHGFAEGGSPDGETKRRENGGDGGQGNVDDDAPLVFRILSHSFLLMML